MKPIDLPSISQTISNFAAERDWDQFHSVKNLAMALSVEVAELTEIFQWLTEEQSNSAASDDKKRQKIKDELADISIYLIRLFEKTGLDMEEVIRDKMRTNAEKYPVSKAKGNAEKYSSWE